MDGARGRAAPGVLFPCRLYAAVGDRRHRLPQQGRDLRPAVHGLGGDNAHHRRRPPASRRPHRHHLGVTHLGFGNDTSSARPHDRAGRRARQGRQLLDLMQTQLLPARACSLQTVPPVDAHQARGGTRGGQAAVLRRSHASCRGESIRGVPRLAQKDALGSSMPSAHSPAPRPCSPICRATLTVSLSQIAV
jgi:hypothetical protein